MYKCTYLLKNFIVCQFSLNYPPLLTLSPSHVLFLCPRTQVLNNSQSSVIILFSTCSPGHCIGSLRTLSSSKVHLVVNLSRNLSFAVFVYRCVYDSDSSLLRPLGQVPWVCDPDQGSGLTQGPLSTHFLDTLMGVNDT